MRREKYGANAISDFHAISKRGMREAGSDGWREREKRERERRGHISVGGILDQNVWKYLACAADSIKVRIVSSRKRGTGGKKRVTAVSITFICVVSDRDLSGVGEVIATHQRVIRNAQ